MPVRYTCRLLARRTSGGKIKVEYGYLGDDSLRILEVTGPRMVSPPEREMTDDEFDRWEFELVAGTGFSYSYSAAGISVDAPLVEAKRTYEDEIPNSSVQAELFWIDAKGQRTLAVRVTNNWTKLIPQFSLSTDCHYDAPQPETVGTVQAHSLGGSESMFHPVGPVHYRELPPRVTAEYRLDLRIMSLLRRRAASVSSESHWIALRTSGNEFDRIPGAVVAAFVEGEGT